MRSCSGGGTAAAVAVALGWAGLMSPAGAQELTLRDALQRAAESGYANAVAAGQSAARAADATASLQAILPRLRVEAGYARTTDPVGAFGTLLRQRAITAADFDPARLNYPGARGNSTAAVVVEQPLLNVDAYSGRRAAGHAAAAAAHMAEWQRGSTAVDVVRAYFGAVLAREQVDVLTSALGTARAHLRQTQLMVREGLVTRSDELLADVRVGELSAMHAEAAADANMARDGLAVLMGAPSDTAFTLPPMLPATDVLGKLPLASGSAADLRADVAAARAAADAAAALSGKARAAFLPRLNLMARYDWNSPDAPFRGDENWSAGVVASWTPIAGGAQLAEVRRADALRRVASVQADAAGANAELTARASRNRWTVAMERVRLAESAVAQSEEAERIVMRKYEGGLAVLVELLGASTAHTQSRLRLTKARHDALVAAAELLHDSGQDPTLLAGLLAVGNADRNGDAQ